MSHVGHQTSTYHEATKTISTPPPPPRWDASPLQVYASIKFASIHLYIWVDRDTVRVKHLT